MPRVPSNLPLLREKSDQMEGQCLTPKQAPQGSLLSRKRARGLHGYHGNNHPPSYRPADSLLSVTGGLKWVGVGVLGLAGAAKFAFIFVKSKIRSISQGTLQLSK